MKYQPTVSQKLIWLDQNISKGSAKYNIGGYASLEGNLDKDIFNEALKRVLSSQEAYSTMFMESGDHIECVVEDAAADYAVEVIDFTNYPKPEESALSWMKEEFARAFDINKGHLFFFKLLKTGSDRYLWYAKIHHLIADGWSFRLLLNQTAEVYDSLVKQKDCPSTIFRYSDYAREDEEYYRSKSAEDDRAFWMNEYAAIPPELFARNSHGVCNARKAASHTLYLSASARHILQTFADSNKLSVFHTIIGLFLLYFGRTRQQQDISIAVPVLNRTKKSYRYTSGVFMNLLALKFTVDDTGSLLDIFAGVKQKMSVALRHQKYQYGNLVSDLKLPHDRLLYDIRVSYEDFDFTQDFGGLKATTVALSNHAETDKLAIYLRDYNDNGFDVRMVYDTAYFDREMIESVSRSISHLISTFASYADSTVSKIALLDPAEMNTLRLLGKGPEIKRAASSFLDLWNDAANTHAASVAISCNNNSFTYEDIDLKAKQLSKILYSRAREHGSLIALLLPGSEKSVIGMLAAMMAGIPYIPLDMAYPEPHIQRVLQDSRCRLLLTSRESDEILQGDSDIVRLKIEQCLCSVDSEMQKTALKPVTSAAPCYIIYTSGSTGTPKGVMISHASLVDYVYTFREHFRITPEDVVLQQASISFDTSVEEIFPVLSVGGRLHMGEEHRDLIRLAETITSEKISVISSNPLTIKFINEQLLPGSLRLVISGGDVLKLAYVKEILRKGIEVYNTYGPTESTVCVTYHRVTEDDEPMPIGKPIANREIYIMDAHQHLQPPGVEGEIVIGGTGLAVGYVGDAALTSGKFIDHFEGEGKKLYLSGDMAIMRPDGSLIFKGRSDDQLNFRGYRIESYDIEKIILENEHVENCIAVVKDFRQTPMLAAYVKYKSDHRCTPTEWRQMIGGRLPFYMVPEVWVPVSDFPLLINGKIDRKKLPDIISDMLNDSKKDKTAPRSGLEGTIAGIWRDILDLSEVGIDDSFFELGGNSLNITQLINRYHRELEIKLSIGELFYNTTIASHAVLIKNNKGAEYSPIKNIDTAPDYPISHGQRRLWMLSQDEDASRSYHLPGQLSLAGTYRLSDLETAIQKVIMRHEILRTVFRENEDGELRQVILTPDKIAFKLKYKDCSGWAAQEIQEYITTQADILFDLANGPLIRAGLIRTGDEGAIFHYNMHHIVSDGWSMELLGKEIMDGYLSHGKGQPVELPSLRLQYKDYTVWQDQQMNNGAWTRHKQFWQSEFSGDIPVFNMATDKPRPPVKSYKGRSILTSIDGESLQGIRSLCNRHQSTLFMGLLGILNVLCRRYTGQDNVIVGSPIAGRRHADLEDQIGFYVNTLALLTRDIGEGSFEDLLNKVRLMTLAAYEHQDYPFDRVVEELGLEGDMSRSVLFDIMIILQNQQGDRFRKKWVATGNQEMIDAGSVSVMFDLVFVFSELGDGLCLEVQFNTDLYESETVIRMIRHYKSILSAVVRKPDDPIDEIEYLSGEERHQLLSDFNDTAIAVPLYETVIDLFKKQVTLFPHSTAVIFEDRRLSYRELDERSDRLAQYLYMRGVRAERLVPICMDRSPEMIVAILGILKAGAAYVPIDPAYPLERIAYILSDTNADLMIAVSDHQDRMETFKNIIKIYPDQEWIRMENGPEGAIPATMGPGNLAYVIYTSGSTGMPKGVMIEHHSLVNLVLGQAVLLNLQPGQGTLQFSSFGFDASCYEIFNTLSTGGFLVLPLQEQLLSLEYFAALIKKYKIDLAVLPPSFQSEIVNGDLSPLSTVVSAGEPLNIMTGKAIRAHNIRLINAYGPTEVTVCASLSDDPIKENNKVTIGRPVPNARIYILDKHGRLLPRGIVGELCIGGQGIARGYLNRPELTAECFVPDRYSHTAGARLYKTKDLGRWLADGNIEYIGRMDDQVKIRGYRIEPAEIEHALLKLPGMIIAAVVAKAREDGEKYLVAYFESKKDYSGSSIRKQLSDELPEYMIPSYFIPVENMPLTPHGKVNRQFLASLNSTESGRDREYIEPRNETEMSIAGIFEEVLGIRNISVRDNFFGLGGNSILLMKIRTRLKRQFGVLLNVKEFYRLSTVEELAEAIEALKWLRNDEEYDSTRKIDEFSI